MRLDSHQHFWTYNEAEYPWIPKGSKLQRNWLPADLKKVQEPLGFDGSIAVQARHTVQESAWRLSLADNSPEVKGVVGWV
ncbi:MAG: amidohydrolase 2, partial [Chthoniobacteraceae bacterium]|nr:amidohydrolase 2 [Chthoniobacteraceae bacterium]